MPVDASDPWDALTATVIATASRKQHWSIEAQATLATAHREYLEDLRDCAIVQARAESLTTVDERHVEAAIRALRADKQGSDWLKRIGFFLAGLAGQQFMKVQDQAPISSGSVNWLVAQIVVALVCLVAAFALDKPKVWRR